jgi:hypothetical protein
MKPDTHTENVDYFAGRLTPNPFEGVDTSVPLQFGQATLLSVHFVTETWGTLEGSAVMAARLAICGGGPKLRLMLEREGITREKLMPTLENVAHAAIRAISKP